MGKQETRIRTSLQGKLPVSHWDDEAIRAKSAKLFHDTDGQTVMLRLDWLKNDLDRQHVKNIGEMMFGKATNG